MTPKPPASKERKNKVEQRKPQADPTSEATPAETSRAGEDLPIRYAAEIKELVRLLDGFTLRELQQIPVLGEGARLRQGTTYIDLQDPARQPFAALAEGVAQQGHWLVPKTLVHLQYWERLCHSEAPKRGG